MLAGRINLPASSRVDAIVVPQHGGRSEELQRAEHCVADEVDDCKGGPAEADFDEDEAELRLRGVGERGLGIRTGAVDEGAEEGGGAADEDDETGGDSGGVQQRLNAQQQVSAGMHTDGTVKDGAGGCGAFHGTGEPAAEGALCRFAAGGEDEHDGDDGGGGAVEVVDMSRPLAAEHAVPRSGFEPMMSQEDAHEHEEICHAIGGKDAEGVLHGIRPVLEETDEQHAGDTDDLPATEQHIERIRHEDQQGAEGEEMQQQKEAEEAWITVQVAHAETADDTGEYHRDANDGQREAIEQKSERKLVVGDLEPMIADGGADRVQITLPHLPEDDADDDREKGIHALCEA